MSQWYKLYRPTSLDKYVFQSDSDREKITGYVKDQDFPDLLLSGHRGTGKTTLGYILKQELDIPDVDFLVLNAADENSVDDIRRIVKPFINTLSFGKFKIVFFDEADSLTPQAQDALKSMMEDESRNARFILTCNKPHKIIPEIKSRCTEYAFDSMDKNSMKRIGLEILMDQGLNVKGLNKDEFAETLNAHVNATHPDLRKFITSLEKHFTDGQLTAPGNDDESLELMVNVLVQIEDNNWMGARHLIYSEMSSDDIESVYRFLDKTLIDCGHFDDDALSKAYVILAHHASIHHTVALPELNLTACVIKLCQLGEK